MNPLRRLWVRKLCATTAGVAMTLCLFELLLFLYSRPYSTLRVNPAPKSNTVLCLGNSYTYGIGAPSGQSYCDQLRELLAKHPLFQQRQLSVVNLAQPTKNTAEILETLDNDLATYRPKLIIVMAGEPNFWKFDGLEQFLAKESEKPTLRQILLERLQRLRTVRLLSYLYSSGSPLRVSKSTSIVPAPSDLRIAGYHRIATEYSKGRNAFSEIPDAEVEAARSEILSVASKQKLRTAPLLLARLFAFRLHDIPQSATWYEQAAQGPTFAYDVFSDLSWLQRQKPLPDSLKTLKSQLDQKKPSARLLSILDSYAPLSPEEKWKYIQQAVASAGSRESLAVLLHDWQQISSMRPGDTLASGFALYELHTRNFSVEQFFPNLERTILENPFGRTGNKAITAILSRISWQSSQTKIYEAQLSEMIGRLHSNLPPRILAPEHASNMELERWIRSDLKEIAVRSINAGARVLLQTYPPDRNFHPKVENEVIREAATMSNVFLSDTEPRMEKRISANADRDSYYPADPSDNHLSAKGYGIVAELILEDILSNKLLE